MYNMKLNFMPDKNSQLVDILQQANIQHVRLRIDRPIGYGSIVRAIHWIMKLYAAGCCRKVEVTGHPEAIKRFRSLLALSHDKTTMNLQTVLSGVTDADDRTLMITDLSWLHWLWPRWKLHSADLEIRQVFPETSSWWNYPDAKIMLMFKPTHRG